MRKLKRRIEELERRVAIMEIYLDFDPVKTYEIENRASTLIPVNYEQLQ